MSLPRLPFWLKQELADRFTRQIQEYLSVCGVNTVCVLAHCPNINACMRKGQLTFSILGEACTRSCRFCAVEKRSDQELGVDGDEPDRLAQLVRHFKLSYAVVTSVTRDDLPDGGAEHFASTIRAIHNINPGVNVEALIPDFLGKRESLAVVAASHPRVMGHNLETVRRLYGQVRPQADYFRSLGVLRDIRMISPSIITKSSLMVGMGETAGEVIRSLQDLRAVSCDIVTIGQYLCPSPRHYPVKEYLPQEQFFYYQEVALRLGFKAALCGPTVRSSYQAERVYQESLCMTL